MPRRLPNRWQPECIREFRASAEQRFLDGLALASAGRRTGAIYLWGYSAEMLIKAAYFSVLGLTETATIGWATHLTPAITKGRTVFSIAWPRSGQGHNVQAWSELLILERISRGTPYANPFALEVQKRGQRVTQLWSEALRYHKNVAYTHEVNQVREAAEWLLVNSASL